jgi:hypothetical protein
VEIASATKYGLLERNEGKIHPTELARRILRPTSTEDEVKGYREAVLKAPDISDVYKHYRGENIPDDETFFRNTLVDTFHIPQADYPDFKRIFNESLEKANLLQKHGDKTVFSMFPRRSHIQKKNQPELRSLGQKLPSELGKRAL